MATRQALNRPTGPKAVSLKPARAPAALPPLDDPDAPIAPQILRLLRDAVVQGELLPGAVLSLQMHHRRAEHWVVVSGTARITRDAEVFDLAVGGHTFIPLGARHRIENPGKDILRIIEVQVGDYLGEDDIVRFEDRYGRQGRTD